MAAGRDCAVEIGLLILSRGDVRIIALTHPLCYRFAMNKKAGARKPRLSS